MDNPVHFSSWQPPFYLYDCKACKLLEQLRLHVSPNPAVGVQKIQQKLPPWTISFHFQYGLMQIFCDVVSINTEEELPWFRVITKKISGIRWPTPSLLHQDEIQAHHQVIHGIFFQAAQRVWWWWLLPRWVLQKLNGKHLTQLTLESSHIHICIA